MILNRNYQNRPSAEYRYFVYDPQGDLLYYATVEERDKAAQEAIESYLDDGWGEGVDQVVVGEASGHTVMRSVRLILQREHFATEEAYLAHEDSEVPSGIYYTCSYEIAPLSDPGEATP